MFYLLNGLSNENYSGDEFHVFENPTAERINRFDHPYTHLLNDLDAQCVDLYDTFMRRIFGDDDLYYKDIGKIPIWVSELGHNSDFRGSKDHFSQYLTSMGDNEDIFKRLYLADCQSIISSIQNCIMTMNWSIVNFYKHLAELPVMDEDGGIYMIQSPSVMLVYSFINSFIISAYSSFDLITKLTYERENLVENFDNYPRLKSYNKLYGDKKKLSCNKQRGTIFEESELVSLIMNLRNDLIHNGSWEQHQKVEVHYESGNVIGKYIYLPDMLDGNIEKFKNRKRFFSQEVILNNVFPELYVSLLRRISKSLDYAI